MLKLPKLRRSHRHIPEGFHFLLEGQPHPLLIPSIIEEVASYLTLPDLKTFRQVCKSWENESTKKILHISKVVIIDEEGLVKFTKLCQHITPKSRQNISYELRGDIDLGSLSATKFFKLFGERIEFIYLNRVRWTDGELKCILFTRLPNLHTFAVEARAYSDRRLFVDDRYEVLPNIKVLKLNVFSFITELTTPFLRDLLKACPNLETLSSIRTEKRNHLPMQFIQYVCQEMSYDTADDVVNMPYNADIAIAEALIDTKDVSLPKLKILDTNMRLRGPGLQQLGLKMFPIKQLDLTLLSDVGTRALQDVLTSLENSLQILKLKFHPRCHAADELEAIPALKNLTHLTLNGYRNSLKFLEILPALKFLCLVRLRFSKSISDKSISIQGRGGKLGSKVECLEVHEDFSRKCTKTEIGTMKRLFPDVKRLKLENLTDDGLSAIFMSYPHLEGLDGMNGCYSDSGILGGDKCYDDGEECEDGDDDNMETESDEGYYACHYPRLPSISDLKELRSLSLASPNLTDKSIIHGVVHCRNLRKLHLLSSCITDSSILRILDELDLFNFKTEYCFQVSKQTVDYAKKKMRGRHVSINEYGGPLKQSEIPNFMRRNGSSYVLMKKMEPQEMILPQR